MVWEMPLTTQLYSGYGQLEERRIFRKQNNRFTYQLDTCQGPPKGLRCLVYTYPIFARGYDKETLPWIPLAEIYHRHIRVVK